MAKLPIGRRSTSRKRAVTSSGVASGTEATVSAANLAELTRNAGYIVDKAGQRQAIVVDWAAWQTFVQRVGANGVDAEGVSAGDAAAGPQAPARAPSGEQSEYALRQDRTGVDLYRPRPASNKEAADFTL